MIQQSLPGFPADLEKAARLRRRRDAKGLDAVLALARCLENLLAPQSAPAIAELAGDKPVKKRGRPRLQRPAEQAPAADQAEPAKAPGQDQPAKLRVVIPPPAIPDYKNIELLADRFQAACLVQDPQAITMASDMYAAFRGWFLAEYAGHPEPSQKRIGGLFRRRFAWAKHGLCRYKGVRIV